MGQLGWWLGMGWVATWLTPIMWTGYFLLLDAVVARRRGSSWISDHPKEVPLLLLLSVLVWLLFEAYNLHMANWVYEGLPASTWMRDLGYFWSFATIMPGVFVTANLLATLGSSPNKSTRGNRSVGPGWLWFLLGLGLVTIPMLLPREVSSHLIGAVWLGFILLLDPINERLGAVSLRSELKAGGSNSLGRYLLAGIICGLLWEAWNAQALAGGGAYWVYTFPERLRPTGLLYGQMPIEGLLGFPPFALELRAFYGFLREMLGGRRVLGPSSLT
jgi:hypothetical protein